MCGRFQRRFCTGNLSQSAMCPSVQLCCLDRPYHTMRCYRCRLFCQNVLSFERCSRGRASSIQVFARWQNSETFSVACNIVAVSSNWLVALTLLYTYYSILVVHSSLAFSTTPICRLESSMGSSSMLPLSVNSQCWQLRSSIKLPATIFPTRSNVIL